MTCEKNLLQPEPAPTRIESQRRPRTTPTPKLPDFTEDPFKDYRYEDLFNIDPFADESNTTDEANANKITSTNNSGKLDPFGFDENSFNSKNSFVKAFDSDFSKSLPLFKNKTERSSSKFDVDFNKAFSDKNRNDLDFDTLRSKSNVIDRAFTPKIGVKSEKNFQVSFRDKLLLSDKKNKNTSNKAWSGIGNNRVLNLMEEEQFALASEQSILDEKERRRLKDQEDAELALALERSKLESAKFENN